MTLELWGGVECTVNRVRDGYRDQLRGNGHFTRPQDIDLFADVGFTTMRYPVLWEHVSPDAPDRCDWSLTDPPLAAMRSHGIGVIAGLVHHGSGPRYTDLLDNGFAPGLARHARNVAERYPWIEAWTPVNEPLTTARFSALYGHWYPHTRDEGVFWRVLLNEIDGVRLAMREVRKVNPAARLIQTDDLGRTYATAALRRQASFDNLRRWAGWDLLCGMMIPEHPLWSRIARFGLEARLHAILDDPCPPDVIGVNHYLTSDRFLDHRLHNYPAHLHGGGKGAAFADVEALRVLDPAPRGFEGALREAFARYGRPLAITEVHNGCTREEQLRWMADAWDTATRLREEGVPVEAVTAWSLIGSQGWNTLLREDGLYEPGVWDLSGGGAPRPTALVPLLRALKTGGARHPLAHGAGWWQRPMRIEHPPVARPAPAAECCAGDHLRRPGPPLLICGATGTLGQAIARACIVRNIPHVLTARDTLDLTDAESIADALAEHRPWAVVNAAGWVRVDDAETARAACLATNADGAVRLAEACAARGIPTLSFSSDLVFDGRKGSAYVEDDAPAPLNVYGESKARMEAGIAASNGAHLTIRTAAFFSPDDDHNFAVAVARTLSDGRRFAAADDAIVTPTYVPHLVATALDLLIDGETGLWHLAGDEAVSWAQFARAVAERCGLDARLIDGVPGASLGWTAARPANAALASVRGAPLPSLEEALGQFACHVRLPKRRQAA